MKQPETEVAFFFCGNSPPNLGTKDLSIKDRVSATTPHRFHVFFFSSFAAFQSISNGFCQLLEGIIPKLLSPTSLPPTPQRVWRWFLIQQPIRPRRKVIGEKKEICGCNESDSRTAGTYFSMFYVHELKRFILCVVNVVLCIVY